MAETGMVERVARAAFKEAASKKHGFWYEGLEWDDLPGLQASFMHIARAAIEAMREPTPQMVSEISETFDLAEQAVVLFWRQGIDAALSLPAEREK